jgi:hypothetical protein
MLISVKTTFAESLVTKNLSMLIPKQYYLNKHHQSTLLGVCFVGVHLSMTCSVQGIISQFMPEHRLGLR